MLTWTELAKMLVWTFLHACHGCRHQLPLLSSPLPLTWAVSQGQEVSIPLSLTMAVAQHEVTMKLTSVEAQHHKIIIADTANFEGSQFPEQSSADIDGMYEKNQS